MKNTIKKAALIIFIFLILFSLTSCSGKYSDREIFGARAAYTISRHIGDARSFIISYIEYTEDDENKKIYADCVLNYTGMEFERYVFIVGTGNYFKEKTDEGQGIYDEDTGMYMVNLGDITLSKNESNVLNEKTIRGIFDSFLKTGDKKLIGLDNIENTANIENIENTESTENPE